MDLIRKNIHIDRMKCRAGTQITLEDDINIADVRPDVFQVVQEQGEIVIEELRAAQDHVHVKGKLKFSVLYLSDDDVRRPSSMEGSIPFEEQIYMDMILCRPQFLNNDLSLLLNKLIHVRPHVRDVDVVLQGHLGPCPAFHTVDMDILPD